ncbi:LOW QUALITY PROTEIN: alpha-1,3-arabinosyltransferase XAT2-like [Primulina tabacum]|uniref:LOW QUALITY PROTEIN: alpha-1,3-arabinosyltransferase XAT2-like n=1 Tax=Primulina tabacum TaxID=48773 RepID=UPI003F599BC4
MHVRAKMYDPILSKSFSQHERKRLGFSALILCLVFALSICSTFKNRMHPLPMIGDGVDLDVSVNAAEDFILIDIEKGKSSKPIVNNDSNSRTSIGTNENIVQIMNTSAIISQQTEKETKKVEPICRVQETMADYCEMEGDIRIQPNSTTIYLVTPPSNTPNTTNSWTMQPYPRKGVPYVKHWTVKWVSDEDVNVPKCTQNHTLPAMLFSLGGFSGNYFHDFADLITPLYSTSYRFKRDVQFLASDYKSFWVAKFQGLLEKLTVHEIVAIDKEKQVHCYDKLVAGLIYNQELRIKPVLGKSNEPSMGNFRRLLRKTFSLERKSAIRLNARDGTRPRLMVITRKRTRILTNEGEITGVARKLGYEVVLAEATSASNMSRFAQVVNSCDVLVGIHGAGLTNMVFLPDNAVLIQIVPLGGIDRFAKLDFENPSGDMNIKYLNYKIRENESSLSEKYGKDHPVLRDPLSFHRNGWEGLKTIYLDNQNVTIDVHRFKDTLAKALKLLRH